MGSRSPKSNQFFYISQQCRCASLVKIYSFLQEIGCAQAIFQQSKPSCEWGQGHQNLISSFTCPSIVDVQVWSKSIHSYKRQNANKPFPNILSPPVTLKMGSRSPKSNQFGYMSQQYKCASLVKIYSFLQEIGCGQAIFQQSKPSCDLENGVKVTKI